LKQLPAVPDNIAARTENDKLRFGLSITANDQEFPAQTLTISAYLMALAHLMTVL